MSYTAHEWQNGETITADKLNNLEKGIQASDYDLVLYCDVYANSFSANNVEILKGNVLECEQKVANGEPVNAIFIVRRAFSYTPSGTNAPDIHLIYYLNYWHCPYTYMVFSNMVSNSSNENTSISIGVINVIYDPNDGSILSINNPYRTIS